MIASILKLLLCVVTTARIIGIPERTELVAVIPCTSDHTCNYGKCQMVHNHTLVCLCDDHWATLNDAAKQPCAYERKDKSLVVILQIMFGYFGAGAFMLGWTSWGIMMVVLFCIACCLQPQSSQKDAESNYIDANPTIYWNKRLTCTVGLTMSVLMIMLLVLTIVHCVDINGVACN